MGVVETITPSGGPRQTDYVGRKVAVVFHYDTSNPLYGRIVRDDLDEPFEMIIDLGVGQHPLRFVRGTECQWRPI